MNNFTAWVRGKESLTLLKPRPEPFKINLIGLGSKRLNFHSKEALPEKSKLKFSFQMDIKTCRDKMYIKGFKLQCEGKIVLFNIPWQNYSYNVQYRSNGPSAAASFGAV